MANTENIEAKLAAYVENELDPADRAQIEQHLAANPQHRALIEELRKTRGYVQSLPRAAAPSEIAETLAAHLERAALLGDVEIGSESSPTHFSRGPQVRAIAAVIVLTCGLAFILYKVLPSPKPAPTNVAIVMPEPSQSPMDAKSEDARSREFSLNETKTDQSAGSRMELAAAAPGATAVAPIDVSQPAYLLIDTPDPVSTSDQVQQYLAQNKISWQPMPVQTAVRDGEMLREFAGNRAGSIVQQRALSVPTTSPADNIMNRAEAQSVVAGAVATTAPSGSPTDNVIVAQMTRDQAVQLSAALSPPQQAQQQAAQIVWPTEVALKDSKTIDDAGKSSNVPPAAMQVEEKPTTAPAASVAIASAAPATDEDPLREKRPPPTTEPMTTDSGPTTAPAPIDAMASDDKDLRRAPTSAESTTPATAPTSVAQSASPVFSPTTTPATQPMMLGIAKNALTLEQKPTDRLNVVILMRQVDTGAATNSPAPADQTAPTTAPATQPTPATLPDR